jgi:Na+/H+-dicarboxylate symporter
MEPEDRDGDKKWIEIPGSFVSWLAIMTGSLICLFSIVLGIWTFNETAQYGLSGASIVSFSSAVGVFAGGVGVITFGAILRDLRRLLWASSDEVEKRSFFY